MKWLILVIALSICLQLVVTKNSDKTRPKKVKHKKPTKTPKSILDEFSSLSDDDKEFIKELDKQFKTHGDAIKIEVEQDNSTTKNPKRTIEGELGYGNQNSAFQRFQFSKPRYQFYPYSQRDILPIPLHNAINNGQFYHGSVQIQPSRAYEIKETPFGYQSYTPNNRLFRPQFTTKPTITPQTYTPTAIPGYPTTQFPKTSLFTSTPGYPGVPSPTAAYPGSQQQQQRYDYPAEQQQQFGEPVIVLRIPGPAKYAAHLQMLLQRYLEIRAAQYIRAFEEHEARVAQQQALFRQQHQQHYAEAEPANYPYVQTDYYKPATKFMVGAPTPAPALQQQVTPTALPTAQSYQSYSAPVASHLSQQIYQSAQEEQPKQLPVSYQQPQISAYQAPKSQYQQFIVQPVPKLHQSIQQGISQAPQSIFAGATHPPAVSFGTYFDQKPQAQAQIAGSSYGLQQPQAPREYTQENVQPSEQAQIAGSSYGIQQSQANREYTGENVQPAEEEVVNIPAVKQSYQSPQKTSEFSLTNILQNQGYFAAKPHLSNFAAPAEQSATQSATSDQAREEEVEEQPEVPEIRYKPVYSNAPVPEGVQEDEDHQHFSYDQQSQNSQKYGPPSPAAEDLANQQQQQQSLPIIENNPRLSHTRIRFNEHKGNADDQSSGYPLPPIPSTTPRQYETAEQPEQDDRYATEEPVVSITQKHSFNYDPQSFLSTDFHGNAPYTQSQFKKLNDLINRLKQRSPLINPTLSKDAPAEATSDE